MRHGGVKRMVDFAGDGSRSLGARALPQPSMDSPLEPGKSPISAHDNSRRVEDLVTLLHDEVGN